MQEDDDDSPEEYVPVKFRKRKLSNDLQKEEPKSAPSLVEIYHEIAQSKQDSEVVIDQKEHEPELKPKEKKISQKIPFHSLWSSFSKSFSRDQGKEREKLGIRVDWDAEDIPPIARSFSEMRIPNDIVKILVELGYGVPNEIEMQILPIGLSRKDFLVIDSDHSLRTLSFSLAMIMLALEQEQIMPIEGGEGPFGLILCPGKESAEMIFDWIEQFTKAMAKKTKFNKLNVLLCCGGSSIRDWQREMKSGVHIIVATTGRLLHMLEIRACNLDLLVSLVLFDANRVLEDSFKTDVDNIIRRIDHPVQKCLVAMKDSSKLKSFADKNMQSPAIVSKDRIMVENFRFCFEIEFVKADKRKLYILDVIQRTAPQAVIFAEFESDVDVLESFLLKKGVKAVGAHKGRSLDDRMIAIREFQSFKRDVLILTDLVSRGIDIGAIKHVIHFDLPPSAKDFIYRMNRISKDEKPILVTAFIDDSCGESILKYISDVCTKCSQKIPFALKNENSE